MKFIGMMDLFYVRCVVVFLVFYGVEFESLLLLVFSGFDEFFCINLVVKVLMVVFDNGMQLMDFMLIFYYFEMINLVGCWLFFVYFEVLVCDLYLLGVIFVVCEKVVQYVYEYCLWLEEKQYQLWIVWVIGQLLVVCWEWDVWLVDCVVVVQLDQVLVISMVVWFFIQLMILVVVLVVVFLYICVLVEKGEVLLVF